MQFRTVHLHIVIVVLTVVLSALTFVPIIARTVHTDSSRVELFIHKYHQDYMQYLAGIVRGQHGLFWYKNPFSVPNPEPSALYLLFPIIGGISGLFNIWAPAAYHISRLIFIFFSVWATYALSVAILKSVKWGSYATLVSILVANPPAFFYNQTIAHVFKPWWDLLGITERFDGLPHHILARGFQCLSLLYFLNYRSSKRFGYYIESSICAGICVFMAPQSVVPYCVIVGFCMVWDILKTFRKPEYSKLFYVFYSLLGLIVPGIALFVMDLATHNPLWIANRQWEVTYFGQDRWTIYHLYISYIALLIPASIGAYIGIRRKDIVIIILTIWILIPLVCAPILPLVGLGGARFDLQMNLFIPLSLLTVIAARALRSQIKYKNILIPYMSILIIWASISAVTYSLEKWNEVFKENLSTRIYAPKEYFELAQWVNMNVHPEQVVLASDEIGTLIVSQAPVFAYIGEQTHGSNWDLNTLLLEQFYSQKMTNVDALDFLKKRDVSYVVEDPKYIWPLRDLTYPFLVKRWQNNQLGIYEVRYD